MHTQAYTLTHNQTQAHTLTLIQQYDPCREYPAGLGNQDSEKNKDSERKKDTLADEEKQVHEVE